MSRGVRTASPSGGHSSLTFSTSLAYRSLVPNPWISSLGIEDLDTWDAESHWKQGTLTGLPVPIGVECFQDSGYKRGHSVSLDIVNDGTHGFIMGRTGSGKSVALKSLIYGLAATYSPKDVQFFVVDTFGSMTAKGMRRLPHTVAAVSSLMEYTEMVGRIDGVIRGEVHRRVNILKHNNSWHISEYNSRREEEDRLPRMVVVFDDIEYAAYLNEFKILMDLLRHIRTIGGFVGIHVIVTCQHFNDFPEGLSDGFRKGYGIILKTYTAASSVEAIGIPDAHTLPIGRGHALLNNQGKITPISVYSINDFDYK